MSQRHSGENKSKHVFINPNVVIYDDGDLEYQTCTNIGTVILQNWYEILAMRIYVSWKESLNTYSGWQGRDTFKSRMKRSCQCYVNTHHKRMERLKKRYPDLKAKRFRTFDL